MPPAYDRALDAPLHCPDPKRRRKAWRPAPHELTLLPADAAGGGAGEEGANGGTAVAARPAKRPRGAANRWVLHAC